MKIKIGSCKYTVGTSSLENDFGICDHSRNTIAIAKDASQDRIRQVMMHEILHAVFFEFGIKNILNRDDKMEEEIIDILSTGLLDTVDKNKKLFRTLLEL